MNQLILPCSINEEDKIRFWKSSVDGYEGQLVVSAEEDGELSRICLSAESEARLYQFLSERRGTTPTEFVTLERIAEPDALTRIAVALEALAPVADALTKLASYATDEPLADSARIP